MCHVCCDEMSGGKSAAQTELAGKDTGANDPGELAGVVTRVCWVRAPDAKHVEHRSLRLENSTTTDGTNFYTRHGNTDLEIAVVAVLC